MYNLGLDLTPEEVKQLKQLALDNDLSVRAQVTKLVKKAISPDKKSG
ncbi:MAG: hypothetical protein ACUZ8A_06395 [Candidatus Bathyanammoxibius sp.]